MRTWLTRPLSRRRGYLAIALTVIAIGTPSVGPALMDALDRPARQLTKQREFVRAAVRRFAGEDFRRWQREHGDGCPPDLAALTAFSDEDATRDLWGKPYAFGCGILDGVAVGFVSSRGEDGELGTDDDLRDVLGPPRE